MPYKRWVVAGRGAKGGRRRLSHAGGVMGAGTVPPPRGAACGPSAPYHISWCELMRWGRGGERLASPLCRGLGWDPKSCRVPRNGDMQCGEAGGSGTGWGAAVGRCPGDQERQRGRACSLAEREHRASPPEVERRGWGAGRRAGTWVATASITPRDHSSPVQRGNARKGAPVGGRWAFRGKTP